MEELKKALDKLKDRQAKNKVQFAWQDKVLQISEDLSLPRFLQTDSSKKPLDVRSILMRHARENLPVFERRFALVKEHGKGGSDAVLYYLGIVESENNAKG